MANQTIGLGTARKATDDSEMRDHRATSKFSEKGTALLPTVDRFRTTEQWHRDVAKQPVRI